MKKIALLLIVLLTLVCLKIPVNQLNISERGVRTNT